MRSNYLSRSYHFDPGWSSNDHSAEIIEFFDQTSPSAHPIKGQNSKEAPPNSQAEENAKNLSENG